MTRDECKKLLMICEATYPNFKVENPTETVDAWTLVLGDFDYQTMETAFKIFVRTSGSAFAPMPSELIAMTRKVKELTMADLETVWNEVREAIRCSSYYHEREFEKLSPLAKKVVGYPGQLRDWAACETQEIETVIYSNFKTRFETIRKREVEIQSMPAEVRELIESATVKQIGVKE